MGSHSNPAFLHSGLTDRILAAFYDVYNELGYGFLESIYTNALALQLTRWGVAAAREAPVEVLLRGEPVGSYRMDLVVNDRIVVEVKSSRLIGAAEERQLLNYLRATRFEVGLLLHFGPAPKPRRFVFTNEMKTRPMDG